MNTIESYLNSTRSAVQKLYQAVDSYYELLATPKRPGFFYWGEYDDATRRSHQEWLEQNKELLEERAKKDNEFAAETFAITTLSGSILQFAFMAIKTCSANTKTHPAFVDLIPENHKLVKFCLGPEINDVPTALIVYAGRNQAHHYDDKTQYGQITTRVFNQLATWYSPIFKKHFSDDRFDLSNPNIINFASNILWLLQWQTFEAYEKALRVLLSNQGALTSRSS